ncbi:hypothetical protein V498_05173 [Pseudogymnoascus sp. VKM F-4517 (FW-2822)]|nr:hypothetical protein V498_05173 [Pseudogymnoascus sp. VKM F-4517 (FW-2822)]
MCYCSVLKQADAANLSESIHAVLELVDNVVSSNVKLKNQLIYTIKRKPLKKSRTRKPRKSLTENLAKDPAKNLATENLAKDPATENSAKDPATENSAKDPATETSAKDPATNNLAADKLAASKLGDLVEEVDIADTRISKIFKCDPRQISANLLLNDKCKEWLQEPSTFLKFDQTPLDQFTNNPQHSAIISIRKLEEQDTHLRILRRLYCIIFSRFRELDSNEDAGAIAKALYKYYYPGQSLCEKNLKQLTTRIRNVENAGKRYDHLSRELCAGAIVILRDDVCNSTNKRPRPTYLSDKANLGTKKRRCSSSAKIIPEVQDDGVATSDKHKTSGICLVSTEMGSTTNETLGVQMILKAVGHIEEESNVASQNQI